MFDLRRWTVCKILAICLCVFFLMEAHALYAQQAAAVGELHRAQFQSAREAYFAGNYGAGRPILDQLIGDLEKTAGQDVFKGETYLLAGATYEKLDQLGMSVKYYCRAKKLLGEGKSIEGLDLNKLRFYRADCDAIGAVLETGVGAESDELVARYNQAKIGYFAGAYEASKTVVESLITSLGAVEGRDTFKGQVYLLAGAVYEVLDFRELALKYYCRAKAILGEGNTIEGLKLDQLKWYKEKCGSAAVPGAAVRSAGRRKSWVGPVIGTILGLALIGGLVWYLFFSKNAPLGKKGTYTSITFRLNVTYRGYNSSGHRRLKIGNDYRNDEDFYYPQVVSSEISPCSASQSESYSYTQTITGSSVPLNQEWTNWDYIAYDPNIENFKGICGDYTIDVESYTYDGKDPGDPSVTGLEQLRLTNTGTQCTAVTDRVKNCSTSTTLTFSAASAARRSSAASVELRGKR